MRAAVLHGPRDLRVEEAGFEPPRGWAVLRSLAVGVCGTDKAFYLGTYRPPGGYPLVPGHEAVGLVVSAPQGYEGLVGRVVVPEINLVEERDMWREPCRSGLYIHCPPPFRRTLGIDYPGALAEYFAVPGWLLHPIGDSVRPEHAVAVEPLAAVLKAFSLQPPRPGDRAAVIGSGLLAALAAQVLGSVYRVEVRVFTRRDSPKRRVLERLGFEVAPAEEAEDFAAREGRWGMGYDVVFEATGSREGLDTAVRVARPRGVVHFKSTTGETVAFNQTLAVVKELQLVASRCGTGREFEEAVRLIEQGVVVVEPLITSVYWGLDKAPEAFERALDRSQIRVVVRPSKAPWE